MTTHTDYSSSGNINLENLDKAHQFTEWMYEQIRPYLSNTILEIGSGTGTYSKKVIRDFPKNKIILSELDQQYIGNLKKTFGNSSVEIVSLDIERGDTISEISKVNAIFALNVFEHIKNDEQAFRNIYNLLQPGGYFIILVPAHPWLYNCIDRSIYHFRRYTKNELRAKSIAAGFVPEKLYFFNFFSIFGWWWNGNVLKKKTIDSGLLGLFDRCVPIFRFIERRLLHGRAGISLVGILHKPKE